MLYRIETCATHETVIFDPGPGETVFDYYTLTENGASLSSEAVPDVDLSGAQRAYVTLLLDFSSSTHTVEADLLASARAFVEALLAASTRVWIGIEIFDGRAAPVTIQRPTPNLDELRTAIAGLSSYSDPLADEGSTNLNGAIAASVGNLQAWQERVIARNDNGIVSSGYLVAFTDGRDTSDLVPIATATSAVAEARGATGTAGALANVQTYAVALSDATDFTPEARANLRTILGDDPDPAVAQRWLFDGGLSELSARFTELAERIARQTEATHLLKYCSAARAGAREVELGILPSRGGGRNTITFSFSAAGFAPGCAAFIDTICVDRACGGFNCGGCDDRSESCVTASGQCVSECIIANQCSGETIETDLGYTLTCDAVALGPTVLRCGGTCIDTVSDNANCGTCGNACETLGGAGERCNAGECVCPGGGEVCAGSCRVASYFETSDANCGTCGNECSGGSSCAAGRCACPGGQTLCDGACRDASYFETPTNCATCGNRCTTVGEVCAAGSCACPSGELVCDGACRAASYFATPSDCGMCDNTCLISGEICVAGSCACASGESVCDGACRVASYFASTSDCGTCGNMCTGPCSAGACQDVAEIAVGYSHSCARLTDGTVRCWGANNSGQLGDGTTSNRLVPVPVSGLANVVEISIGAGGAYSCARLADGTVRCWGQNAYGQLGDGTTIQRTAPVAVSGLTGAVAIATGSVHSCAVLAGGTVRCWGFNSQGALGNGTLVDSLTPTPVSGVTSAASVTAGAQAGCALLTDGTVRCWGNNGSGQVGDGTTTQRLTPVAVAGLTGAVEIAAGSFHTCARLTGGAMRCWGNNLQGQLGDGTLTRRLTPVAVSSIIDAAEITTSGFNSCARLTDGTVRCWGYNRAGQVGDGTTTDRLTPVAVFGLTGVVGLATSGTSSTSSPGHSCARLTDGSVQCWGQNDYGQLGDRTTTNRLTPVAVIW